MQARLIKDAPEKTDSDAILIPMFEGQTTVPAEALNLDKRLKGALGQLVKNGEFRGRLMEIAFVHNLGNVPSTWTVLVGVGKKEQIDMVRLRNALQSAARSLRRRGHRRVAVVLPKEIAGTTDVADLASAATEGVALGNFHIGYLGHKPRPNGRFVFFR